MLFYLNYNPILAYDKLIDLATQRIFIIEQMSDKEPPDAAQVRLQGVFSFRKIRTAGKWPRNYPVKP